MPWKYPKEGDHKPKWITAQCLCGLCCVRWVAVYPTTARGVECPNCGYMNPREDELA